MTTLRFDPHTHVFTRDGQRVLSVTQILRRCGLCRNDYWTQEARDRGTRVHQALHLLQTRDEGAARAHLWDEDLAYFTAGVLALQTFGLTVLGAEELVDGGSYAGWLDLRCQVRGHEDPFVVDFKSGRAPVYAPIQLSAYAAPQASYHRRAVIELLPSGTPRFTTCHETRGDLRHWHACVSVALLQTTLEIANGDD